MGDKGDEHKCNICNKLYSSYKTLWKHNKNFHKNNKVDNSTNVLLKSTKNVESLNYKCRYCEKNYELVKSRWKHEQKCKINYTKKAQEKQSNDIKLAEINKEKEIKLAEIELEKFNHTKEIELAKINLELKKVEIRKEYSLIKKEQKSHNNPTIKKINKILQNKINMNNSNLNSNNTTNIQNIVHNHFKIEPFGKENILALISDKEKKLILNQGCESIEKLVEISCAGKYDQLKNIIITNKRDNDVYIYDDKSGVFINNDKNVILNKLVANRLENVEEIYNEFDENNKLSDSNRKILSRFFLKFIDESKPFIDENSNNKEYKNYLDFKVDKVKNILFNNQEKIINDISLAINKSE
jgi:hypothetical protein